MYNCYDSVLQEAGETGIGSLEKCDAFWMKDERHLTDWILLSFSLPEIKSTSERRS